MIFNKLICNAVLVVFGVLISNCGKTTESRNSSDMAALAEFQKRQRKAHLTYDAGLFVSMFNDTVMQLKDGNISKNTKQENLTRIKSYLDAVEFIEWEDIKPPVIRISGDGSMAYAVVHKRVRLKYEDEQGQPQEGHTIFAWLETWEKINGVWKLMVVASTDK